ncbi:hypothetical protein Ocin01_04460 [Orchesella cincta]|uniref:Uncharacterized protein n=1 Tax=Orchesella cincta TaxID=48709 RepID=A0A1D2NAE2_ORCCI|nr:hypothetical protein Ocin01_04460 [Orchesella cincta]
MGNFRQPNAGSQHSSEGGSPSPRGNSTSTSGKKPTNKASVGWTNLRKGRRKKPVPMVELSSDTDFEEMPVTQTPKVVVIERDADRPIRQDKNEVEVVLFNAISDTEEESINVQKTTGKEKKATRIASRRNNNNVEPVTPIVINGSNMKTKNHQSNSNAEESSQTMNGGRNGSEWGRDSDEDSYVTLFIPKDSNIETAQNNKKKRKRDDDEDASRSSTDFEVVAECINEPQKPTSSSRVNKNSSSSENENADSDSSEESSSQELITTRSRSSSRKRKTLPAKRSNAKRSRFEAEKKKTKVVKKKSTKRATRQTSRGSKIVESETDEDKDCSKNSSRHSSSESDEEISSSRKSLCTRRSTRQSIPKKLDKKEKIRQDAFEKLRKKRETQAKRPKRKSPVREVVSSSEEEDSDSDGNYSPVPIVSNSSEEGTDFDGDGSTPSSSSVTSAGETDEEPDLEIGGSEGEKDLPNSEEASEGNGDTYTEVASCSSSSDEEPPSDGQNDTRCILCKNLKTAAANIEGRAKRNNPRDWCKCGECKIFARSVGDYDLVCCREIKAVKDFLNEELEDKNVCITNHPRFEADVLKNEGYARSISKHKEPYSYWQRSYWQEHDDRHSSRRVGVLSATTATEGFKRAPKVEKTWKSFSSYKYWIFDKLGVSDSRQMVIPACVKAKVFDKFGTQSNFVPFHPPTVCPCKKHCGPASSY